MVVQGGGVAHRPAQARLRQPFRHGCRSIGTIHRWPTSPSARGQHPVEVIDRSTPLANDDQCPTSIRSYNDRPITFWGGGHPRTTKLTLRDSSLTPAPMFGQRWGRRFRHTISSATGCQARRLSPRAGCEKLTHDTPQACELAGRGFVCAILSGRRWCVSRRTSSALPAHGPRRICPAARAGWCQNRGIKAT